MFPTEGHKETSVINLGNAANEPLAFNDFPFSSWKLHTEGSRIEEKIEHLWGVLSHDLAHIRVVELKDPASDRSSRTELLGYGKVLVLEQKPISISRRLCPKSVGAP
jgi:hypothetical protein